MNYANEFVYGLEIVLARLDKLKRTTPPRSA